MRLDVTATPITKTPTVMTAQEFLNADVPTLALTDSAEHALDIMAEFHVRHLPIVGADGVFHGLMAKGAVQLDGRCVGELPLPRPVVALPDAHVLDVAGRMVEHRLTGIPVVAKDERYLGLVLRADLFDHLARMLASQDSGAVLVIACSARDTSLSKLLHVVEQSDTKVRSVATEMPLGDGGPAHITLKLNRCDSAHVRHLLQYYGYTIVASYGEEDDYELQMRIEEFMRFLEV